LLLSSSAAFANEWVYQDTLRSTIWILKKNPDSISNGTGVLVDAERKLVLTNAQVVGDGLGLLCFFPDFRDDRPQLERQHYLNNVQRLGVTGKIIAVDQRRDLALVELDRLPEGVLVMRLAEKSVAPGEKLHAIGNLRNSDSLWYWCDGVTRTVYNKRLRINGGETQLRVVEANWLLLPRADSEVIVNDGGELVAITTTFSTSRTQRKTLHLDTAEVKKFLTNVQESKAN